MSENNGNYDYGSGELEAFLELNNGSSDIELRAANGRRATAAKWAAAGTSGIEMTGGFLNLAHTAELTWPGVYPLFERIRRTDPEIAIVRGLFNALAQEVRLEWKEPESANEAEKRFTDFMRTIFDDVAGGMTGLATTALNQIPFMGWGWWEVLPSLRRPGWKAPGSDDWESQYTDGLIGVRRFDWRHHDSFMRWDADEKSGRVLGFVQNDSPNDEVVIPLARSLHVVHGDTVSPEGLSPLEALWRLERYKFNLEIVQGVGFSHAAGHMKFKTESQLTPADKAIIRAAALSVFSGREGAYMSLPRHIDGDLIDGNFTAAAAILEAIRYYGIVKLQVFMMQWAAMSTTSGAGSYSAHRDGSSMFVTFFNGMMGGYAAQIGKQLAKRVLGWNRMAFAGLVRLPTLTATPLDKAVELGSLSNFVAQVWPMMDISEEDILAVRKYSGVMPVKVPAPEDVVEKPQPAGQAMGMQPGNLEEGRRRRFFSVGDAELADYSDSVMVAFYLDDEPAKKLSELDGWPEGSEPTTAEEMHVTLAYLGERDGVDREQLITAVRASSGEAISGAINGYGRFTNTGREDGMDAVFAIFDSQALPEFRQKLVDGLKAHGIELQTEHGFVPHITLAYVPKSAELGGLEVPTLPLSFGEIVVKYGNEAELVPLDGTAELYSPSQPRDKYGRFGSGGGGGSGFPTGTAREELLDRMWEFEPGHGRVERPSVTGISRTSIHELETGEKVLLKSINGGDAMKEVAAYEIATHHMGLDIVPPISERRNAIGGNATIQLFVEDGHPLMDYPGRSAIRGLPDEIKAKLSSDDMVNVAMLDIVTGNSDRHAGNILIRNNGRILAIDNDSAFHGAGGVQAWSHANDSVRGGLYNAGSLWSRSTGGEPLVVPASRMKEIASLREDLDFMESITAIGGSNERESVRRRLESLNVLANDLNGGRLEVHDNGFEYIKGSG